MANTATTTRPSPIFLPEPPKIFQQSTDQEAIQQPASTQTQQRTFLLTTLLPICIVIVILLAVALAIVWYLKFRGGATGKNQQKLDSESGGGAANNEGTNAERVPLKEDKKSAGKKNGLTIANNGSRMTNKTPKKSGKILNLSA